MSFVKPYLIDKVISTGGIIVFDDVLFPGIRKVLRFVSTLPNYKIIDTYPGNRYNFKKQLISKLIKLIPFHTKIYKEELIITDYDSGINSNCVAVQKMEEDNRKYDFHRKF